MIKEPPLMIFKNSVQKHTVGLNYLNSPKIMRLHEEMLRPLQLLVPIQD